MASGRSGSSSSFNSSSLGAAPPSHFTPTSAAISALTAESSIPQSPLGPLDLGPPGYHATIKLFERTANEATVYLGPWEIVGTNPRRIVWQCSYAGDVLEHLLPSESPNELYPFTLHAQHRRFGDPREMELYLSFLEPHHLRYITRDGVLLDDYVEVKYEFTTIEGSIQFQSDVRTRDLIDWFDIDVVWTDTTRRTDSYGNVRGLGTIQRMKLWRDRYSTLHYLTVYANHQWRWKEFLLDNFDKELRQRDDRHRRVQLGTRAGRRGSASSSITHSREQRRFSAAAIFGGRRGSSTQPNGASSSPSPQAQASPEIRYLGMQFSRNPNVQTGTDDYTRFLVRWDAAHDADGQFEATFPTEHIELPSPYLNDVSMQQTLPYVNGYHVNGANDTNGIAELPSPAMVGLSSAAEPDDGPESDRTQ